MPPMALPILFPIAAPAKTALAPPYPLVAHPLQSIDTANVPIISLFIIPPFSANIYNYIYGCLYSFRSFSMSISASALFSVRLSDKNIDKESLSL